jgi:hypothetical protein
MREPILRAAALKLRPALPRVFGLLQRLESRLQKLNTHYEKSAPMAPELRELLRLQFEPEVQRLGQLLGRDLSDWNRAGRVGVKSSQPSTNSPHDHACLVSTGVS